MGIGEWLLTILPQRRRLIRRAREHEVQHLRSQPQPVIDLESFPTPPHVHNHVWPEDSQPIRRHRPSDQLGFVEQVESLD